MINIPETIDILYILLNLYRALFVITQKFNTYKCNKQIQKKKSFYPVLYKRILSAKKKLNNYQCGKIFSSWGGRGERKKKNDKNK